MALVIVIGISFPNVMTLIKQTKLERQSVQNHQDTLKRVVAYLNRKQSPLSEDEASLLLKQKHWRLLIGLMGIESQFCRRQLGYNCFGLGGDSAYRHYNNFSESIIDADALITRWQKKGRWLTVADMNGHYVQPFNENLERVVNKILKEIQPFY